MPTELIARVSAELGPSDWTDRDRSGDDRIAINAIASTPRRPYYTLCTTGMSQVAMVVPADGTATRHAELTLCLPACWFRPDHRETLREPPRAWLVQLLYSLARLPREERSFLAPLHTICTADTRSRFPAAIVVDPVLWPHALKTVDDVLVMGVVPILPNELSLAHEIGGAAFWRELWRAGGGTELLQLDRPPVYLSEVIGDDDDRLDERSRWAAVTVIDPRASRTFPGFAREQDVPRVCRQGEYTLVTSMPKTGELVGLPHAGRSRRVARGACYASCGRPSATTSSTPVRARRHGR